MRIEKEIKRIEQEKKMKELKEREEKERAKRAEERKKREQQLKEEEEKALYDKNIRSKAIMTGIGYKELYEYFDGNCTLDEALELIAMENQCNVIKDAYEFYKKRG